LVEIKKSGFNIESYNTDLWDYKKH
jgi:hypothetical protein